nr:hypothetical protein CFP56_37312 [Quercus suber]
MRRPALYQEVLAAVRNSHRPTIVSRVSSIRLICESASSKHSPYARHHQISASTGRVWTVQAPNCGYVCCNPKEAGKLVNIAKPRRLTTNDRPRLYARRHARHDPHQSGDLMLRRMLSRGRNGNAAASQCT